MNTQNRKTQNDLRNLLRAIDHRGYPAYKDTRGVYDFDGYALSIDHVQGDPFAAPSKVSLWVQSEYARFPREFYEKQHRRVALQDLLTRRFCGEARKVSHRTGGSGKSGLIAVCEPGQEILERTSCRIMTGEGGIGRAQEAGEVVFRLEVGFPANGRTINAGELMKIFWDFLPACVERALVFHEKERALYEDALALADDQLFIRGELARRDLCAFVANGSILPRKSGVSDLPMKEAVKFVSPEPLAVTLSLPHGGNVTGMGIRRGITLIVGGGYHGKSTLLAALERGVYDHIRGDGREYVITDASAVKIRAEDGRCVHRDDISLFIRDLPDGRDTAAFSTEDASGSTSQAANVVEALEAGAGTLLIDEDTCATNFMVRDALMQRVIHRDKEPITPFIERMRPLYEELGVSCVLVAGSSGAFFDVADTVIQMDCYVPKEITAEAKTAARESAAEDGAEATARTPFYAPSFLRTPQAPASLRESERVKIKTMGTDGFSIDRENVDLRYLAQLVDREQTAAIAQLVRAVAQGDVDGAGSGRACGGHPAADKKASPMTMRELLDALEELLDRQGLEALCGRTPVCGLARPRRQEIAGAINRCRFFRF